MIKYYSYNNYKKGEYLTIEKEGKNWIYTRFLKIRIGGHGIKEIEKLTFTSLKKALQEKKGKGFLIINKEV